MRDRHHSPDRRELKQHREVFDHPWEGSEAMNQESGRKLVVMGQGYVGIPLAMRALEAGFNVVGFDVDKARVDCLARGETFIEDVTDYEIAQALLTGKYLPTSDPAALAGF